MSIPFRYKLFSVSNELKVLDVTEENYLDMLHTICSVKPKLAYWNVIIFAWKCTDFYDDETMFDTYQGGMAEELFQIFRSFIYLNYPGSHWATDKDFLCSLLTFIIDKMEAIEYNAQTHLNLTFSTHRKKVYEQVARVNRGTISK